MEVFLNVLVLVSESVVKYIEVIKDVKIEYWGFIFVENVL